MFPLALDGQGFDGPCYIPMQMQFDGSNLAETQVHPDHSFFLCWTLLRLQFPARTIGIRKGGIAIASLKSRVPRLFPVLHSAKEPIKSPFQTKEDILEHMRSNLLIFWPDLFDLHKIALLFVNANGMFCGELLARRLIKVVRMPLHFGLIGIAALLQASVVKLAAEGEHPIQVVSGAFVGGDSVFVRFDAHGCRFPLGGETGEGLPIAPVSRRRYLGHQTK